MDKRKVVLVGTGFVGMSMAYSILNTGGLDEIVLIDIDKEKAIGEGMDLSHGLAYAPQKMKIIAGDYSDCKDANIVVITAGANRLPNQNRLELCEINAKIIKEITQKVVGSGFDGVFLVASNPVDIITYVVSKVSGFPKNKIIGTGTILDTARLRYILAEHFEVSAKNVHAYVIGEHGDSSFVSWEHSYIGCKNILDILKYDEEKLKKLDTIHEKTKNAAYEIIQRKKATYYGIGMALTRLVKAILNNENSINTVTTKLEGEYNQKDIFIGVPAIINKNGVKEIIELELNDENQEKLNKSSNILMDLIKEKIDIILEKE